MTDAILERLDHYLALHELRIVTAESCTAGLVASLLADIVGCGKWFEAGYVTYSPSAKHRTLGVKLETIREHGLTSEAVAAEMALGALVASGADLASSNTGIAGPGSESGIAAGTVCFAWAVRRASGSHDVRTETRHFAGTRNAVRMGAARHAIDHMVEQHQQALRYG